MKGADPVPVVRRWWFIAWAIAAVGLIVARVFGLVSWSWWLVLAPAALPICYVLVLLALVHLHVGKRGNT